MSDRTFLEEISIRSIGVIEHSTLEIAKGLTVLSGETGAGKTMILTALNLILGGKADSALVRKGSERLIASGKFSIPTAICEVGEITSGRENKACAEIGRTTNASTCGQTTGPPVENA